MLSMWQKFEHIIRRYMHSSLTLFRCKPYHLSDGSVNALIVVFPVTIIQSWLQKKPQLLTSKLWYLRFISLTK